MNATTSRPILAPGLSSPSTADLAQLAAELALARPTNQTTSTTTTSTKENTQMRKRFLEALANGLIPVKVRRTRRGPRRSPGRRAASSRPVWPLT